MKIFSKHALILGGFYFMVSLLYFLPTNMIIDMINVVATIIFLIMLLVLCFKKEYSFINRFQNKFPKISNYIEALGYPEYFSIIFIVIPAAIYGYKASKAQYTGTEIPEAPIEYLQCVYYIYIAILVISIIWATYKSFIKNKNFSKKD